MNIQLKKIGTFHCPQKYTYELPRQSPLLTTKNKAFIELNIPNASLALKDLDGFSHIWVIFLFHENNNWKPLISPPSLNNQKVGVFASRSPHRPNPIGMSLVEIEDISRNRIYLKNYDLINNSPILDLKPYISFADTPNSATQGWIESDKYFKSINYQIKYSQLSLNKLEWLNENLELNFLDFIQTQLSTWPKRCHNKRVSRKSSVLWTISYRTWRIDYLVNDTQSLVTIEDIYSGYNSVESRDLETDIYIDKKLHLQFESLEF